MEGKEGCLKPTSEWIQNREEGEVFESFLRAQITPINLNYISESISHIPNENKHDSQGSQVSHEKNKTALLSIILVV